MAVDYALVGFYETGELSFALLPCATELIRHSYTVPQRFATVVSPETGAPHHRFTLGWYILCCMYTR